MKIEKLNTGEYLGFLEMSDLPKFYAQNNEVDLSSSVSKKVELFKSKQLYVLFDSMSSTIITYTGKNDIKSVTRAVSKDYSENGYEQDDLEVYKTETIGTDQLKKLVKDDSLFKSPAFAKEFTKQDKKSL